MQNVGTHLYEIESVGSCVEPGVSLLTVRHLSTDHLTLPTHHLTLHLLLCIHGHTYMYMYMATLPVTPAQLKRPGIGRNTSCALGNCSTSVCSLGSCGFVDILTYIVCMAHAIIQSKCSSSEQNVEGSSPT